MEKINIENLLHCKINSTNSLDIESMTKRRKPFDTDSLIKTREIKRKRLLNYYIKFYDNCLKKIEIANNLGKTDLLYCVDTIIYDCPEYRPIDCIKYIKNKLDQDFFDTYIVENKTLFITWIYLEVNRENINKSSSPIST